MMDKTFLEIGNEVAARVERMPDKRTIAGYVCTEISKAYNCGYRDAMEERKQLELRTE